MVEGKNIRIVLADDHQMVRQGLLFFLSTQPNITVVGQAENGAQALLLVETLRPDVILLDLVLPDMDGLEVTRSLHTQFPAVKILVLTSFIDDAKVVSAIQAGAAGYLMKDIDPVELADAIHAVSRGEIYLHQEAARKLAHGLRFEAESQQEALLETLTERELEVLKLVARGMSNQEIATQLNVTLQTIKAHMSSILQKLGLESRVQAVLYALRHHMVTLDQG